MKIKLQPNTRWKLTLKTSIKIREITVDSSSKPEAISINGASAEGVSIEQLPDTTAEFSLHSFEESGNQSSGSELVCSRELSTERKKSI